MKKRNVILLVAVLIFASLSISILTKEQSAEAASDFGVEWEVMAPLPEPRVNHAVVADDNQFLYVFGGNTAYDGNYTERTATSYRYDIMTNTWDLIAPIPVALAEIDAGLINGKIYIPGDASTSTTYIYSIATNTWSEIPNNGKFSNRSQYKVAVSGTDLFMLGGCCGYDTYTEVWILDSTTGKWSPGIPMNYKRQNLAAGFVGGKLYAVGGYKASDDNVTSIEVFDGVRWTYLDGRIPSNCEGEEYPCYGWSHMASAVTETGFLLAGGVHGRDVFHLDHTAFFDPTNESWITHADLPLLNYARHSGGGGIIGDYFYVVGGANGTAISTANERLFIGAPAAETPQLHLYLPLLQR